MKKIQYSVGMMGNPQHEDDPQKAYAKLQQTGVVDIDELAEHISEHNSVFSKGTIVGILTELGVCMRELILQGYRVILGTIGSFAPAIKSKGAVSRETFSAANITDFKVKYQPGCSFDNLLRDAEFEKTATLRAKAATLAAETKGETTVDISKPVAEGEGEGEGSGSEGNDEP